MDESLEESGRKASNGGDKSGPEELTPVESPRHENTNTVWSHAYVKASKPNLTEQWKAVTMGLGEEGVRRDGG